MKTVRVPLKVSNHTIANLLNNILNSGKASGKIYIRPDSVIIKDVSRNGSLIQFNIENNSSQGYVSCDPMDYVGMTD